MFYTWKEFSDWTNITLFEVFWFLIVILINSFLFTIKILVTYEPQFKWFSWWWAMSPLFLYDALSAYFCLIIFIRQYNTGVYRAALLRGFFAFKRISLLFLVKILLCYRLENAVQVSYMEIFLPLFYLTFMLIFRSFRL